MKMLERHADRKSVKAVATDLAEANRQELADLCREYDVVSLELFGSAADGTFDPQRSDLDFLVEFESSSARGELE